MAEKETNFLSLRESALLCNFIEKHYIESGLSDKEFAERATTELEFPISHNHIRDRRKSYEIESNTAIKKELEVITLESLDKRISKLESLLEKL